MPVNLVVTMVAITLVNHCGRTTSFSLSPLAVAFNRITAPSASNPNTTVSQYSADSMLSVRCSSHEFTTGGRSLEAYSGIDSSTLFALATTDGTRGSARCDA